MKRNKPNAARVGRKAVTAPMKIGIAVTLVAVIIMIILMIVPSSGIPGKAPTVILTGDTNRISTGAITNSIHEAGFNLEILPDDGRDIEPNLDEDEQYIIMAVGESGCRYLNRYSGSREVIGFVLVCPVYPNDNSLSGVNKDYPDKDIAIFAGADDADTVQEIGDARLLYERMSGDDTVYGTPIKRGSFLSSTCYANNLQNRWLSLSHGAVSNPAMLVNSALFQTELAGYLSVAYGGYVDGTVNSGRIISWFVFGIIAAFTAFIGLMLMLADIPVLRVPKDVWREEKTALHTVISCGLSLVVAAGVIICSQFESMRRIVGLVPYFPIVIALFTLITYIRPVISSLKTSTKIPRLPDFLITAMVLIPLALFMQLHFDAFRLLSGTLIVAGIIDFLIYLLLVKSSVHTGRAPFVVMLLSSLIVAVVMILVGLVLADPSLRISGVSFLVLALMSHIAALPIRLHSGSGILAGVLHSAAFVLVLAVIA